MPASETLRTKITVTLAEIFLRPNVSSKSAQPADSDVERKKKHGSSQAGRVVFFVGKIFQLSEEIFS